MVESALMNQQNTPASFKSPKEEISKAVDTAALGGKRNITQGATDQADTLRQSLSRYGGEAINTGAAKGATADIFAKANRDISNLVLSYEVQKQQLIQSGEQYLQNLTAQGILDPTTGNFLRSSYDQNLEVLDIQFRNRMRELDKMNSIQNENAFAQGLGQIGGFLLGGPVGSFMGGEIGKMFDQEAN